MLCDMASARSCADKPSSSILSACAVTRTRSNAKPCSRTSPTPSTRSMRGMSESSTMRLRDTASPSLETLSCITGNVSVLMRSTLGVSTSSGRSTELTALSMSRSASFISTPKSKVAIMTVKLALEVDSSSFKPVMPLMAFSIGSATSLATVSGLELGYTATIKILGNSSAGNSSRWNWLYW